MNDKKRYYKDIKRLFTIYGKKEREFLEGIKKQVDDLGDCDYKTLIEEIGEPTDIISTYYQYVGSDYILKKLKTKRLIQCFCIIITVIVLITCLWRTYVLNEAYENFKNSVPTEIEERIEED